MKVFKSMLIILMVFFTVSNLLLAEDMKDNMMSENSSVGGEKSKIGNETLDTGSNGLEEIIKDFHDARRGYYNAEEDLNTVIDRISDCEGKLETLEDGFDKFYYTGQVDFLKAEIYEVLGNKRQTATYFNFCAENAGKALKAIKSTRVGKNEKDESIGNNVKSSEAYRLQADSYMRLMSYNGTLYMMSKGPEIIRILEQSLHLDTSNYRALNSQGTYYINAPQFGGGDVMKGINVLKKALKSEDRHDNFISYIWLAQAYSKIGYTSQALENLSKAREIYPDSSWADAVQRSTGGGK